MLFLFLFNFFFSIFLLDFFFSFLFHASTVVGVWWWFGLEDRSSLFPVPPVGVVAVVGKLWPGGRYRFLRIFRIRSHILCCRGDSIGSALGSPLKSRKLMASGTGITAWPLSIIRAWKNRAKIRINNFFFKGSNSRYRVSHGKVSKSKPVFK